MRLSLCIATFLVPFLFFAGIFTTQMDSPRANNDHHHGHDQFQHSSTNGLWSKRENKILEKPMGGDSKGEKVGSRRSRTLQTAAGSRLPDCMHACGSCSPCRLVTVSFACASHTDEAGSCPISYRCMCNSKSYPIP